MFETQKEINEELELLKDEEIRRFENMITRFDFGQIREAYKFMSDVWYTEKELAVYDQRMVTFMIELYPVIIDLAYPDLTEFLELIEGTVEEFLISFHRLFFIDKIQNQL